MRKPLASVSTRTEESTPRDLPLQLRDPPAPSRQAVLPERRPADRIKDALLRWLEEEM